MKILEKICNKAKDIRTDSVTIAFLGDSVTQGVFDNLYINEENIDIIFDYKSVYSTRVREILNILYPTVQFNIINSGISGDTAKGGLDRVQRDIIDFKPDLCVVSFGLNDTLVGNKQEYLESLDKIFKTLKERNIEVIFLTQNAFNCYVSKYSDKKLFVDFAKQLADIQNSGKLKEYFGDAKKVAEANNVKVCDLYPLWEKMMNNCVNTTELLANKLNHPIREYHYYIAIKLIETMFDFK